MTLEGDFLHSVDGDLAAVARALRRARGTLGTDNLKGVRESFEGLMDANLLDYLKEVEAFGVPARSTGPRAMASPLFRQGHSFIGSCGRTLPPGASC